jgi:hypothetical protein
MRSIWKDEDVHPEEALWRYFRADHFVSALQSCRLHFPSVRQFEYRFEGAVAVLPHDLPNDPRYPEPDDLERAFEELRRLTKVSCWHRAECESDAMWKLYAADRKGVAIRTSAARLRSALQPFRLAPEYGDEVPYWGKIRYVDLHAERLRATMEERFLYKHRAFEWEREFRVVISVRMAEEFGVCVPETGIDVPFVPTDLIDCIYLGPALLPDDREAVTRECTATGLKSRLRTSTLLGRPRYT